MKNTILHSLFCSLMLALSTTGATQAQQELGIRGSAPDATEVGTYYPKPVTIDTKKSQLPAVLSASAILRQRFADSINQNAEKKPNSAFAATAVGPEKETLVITALHDGTLDTDYRARAVLSRMTAMARVSALIQEFGVSDAVQIEDYLGLFGFTKLIISDGRAFAYQLNTPVDMGGDFPPVNQTN